MSLDVESVLEQLEKTGEMYHRLVLVVAPSGSGKTAVLQDVAGNQGVSCLNVNLELSKRMLDLTTKQRAIHAARVLREVVDGSNEKPRVLDNLEILFDRSLQLDPLRPRMRALPLSTNQRTQDHRGRQSSGTDG